MSEARIGVGFDIDHTIVIDNKLERVAFLRLLEILIDDGGRPLGSLCDEIFRIDDLLERQRGGAFTIDEAVASFVRERDVLVHERYAQRYRQMAVDMVGDFVVPLPGARQAFAALRDRGAAVAVLSNGWNPLQTHKARRAGFEGPVLVSADLGVQKPNREAFDALLDVLGTHVDRTWYVGDDPHCDVEGARAAGLRAVWLDADHRRFPPNLPAAPVTITRLDELAARVAEDA